MIHRPIREDSAPIYKSTGHRPENARIVRTDAMIAHHEIAVFGNAHRTKIADVLVHRRYIRFRYDLAVDALPADVRLRDMGSHRLRDLQRPERVFQVVAPGLRDDFPPLKSLDPRRHNLPISATEERAAEMGPRKVRS